MSMILSRTGLTASSLSWPSRAPITVTDTRARTPGGAVTGSVDAHCGSTVQSTTPSGDYGDTLSGLRRRRRLRVSTSAGRAAPCRRKRRCDVHGRGHQPRRHVKFDPGNGWFGSPLLRRGLRPRSRIRNTDTSRSTYRFHDVETSVGCTTENCLRVQQRHGAVLNQVFACHTPSRGWCV